MCPEFPIPTYEPSVIRQPLSPHERDLLRGFSPMQIATLVALASQRHYWIHTLNKCSCDFCLKEDTHV